MYKYSVLTHRHDRKTHLQHLTYELDNFADQLELWIVKRPQVRHDHERPSWIFGVFKDFYDGYAVVVRMLEGSQELCDLYLLTFVLQALDRNELPARVFCVNNVQLLLKLSLFSSTPSRREAKLTLEVIESSQYNGLMFVPIHDGFQSIE